MTTETIKVVMDKVQIAKVEDKEGRNGNYKLVTVIDASDMERHTFCDRTNGLVAYEPQNTGRLTLRVTLKRWQKEGNWQQGYSVEVIGFASNN